MHNLKIKSKWLNTIPEQPERPCDDETPNQTPAEATRTHIAPNIWDPPAFHTTSAPSPLTSP